MTSSKEPFGIYIHVPFCLSKCPYCDFYSERDQKLVPNYVEAVKTELRTLERCKGFVSPDIYEREVTSIYFGGGTPSLLAPSHIGSVIKCVKESFPVSTDAEITLECNPSVKEKDAFFLGIRQAGVNRVSLGLQSAVLSERRALGRLGSPEDAKNAVLAAKSAGIDDISLDIMLGIPGQTEETLKESLDFALSLPVTHLSVYILKLEEGTLFYKRRETLSLPDDDQTADMYLFMCSYLKEKGMRHYEISNFCFGDNIGRHNMSYWRCSEYLGVGPAAHSFVNSKRIYSERDLRGFLNGQKCVYDGPGGTEEERLMLALRTDEGAAAPDTNAAFKKRAAEFAAMGLVNCKNGRAVLTEKGFLLSNYVISELLSVM